MPAGQTAPATVSAAPKPAGVALGQLPTFVPFKAPEPDLPGTADGIVSPGYINYPKDKLVQTVKDPPGRGGDVSVTLETSNPPPPPMGENAAWQAVNKAVNAKNQRHDHSVRRLQRQVGHDPGR